MRRVLPRDLTHFPTSNQENRFLSCAKDSQAETCDVAFCYTSRKKTGSEQTVYTSPMSAEEKAYAFSETSNPFIAAFYENCVHILCTAQLFNLLFENSTVYQSISLAGQLVNFQLKLGNPMITINNLRNFEYNDRPTDLEPFHNSILPPNILPPHDIVHHLPNGRIRRCAFGREMSMLTLFYQIHILINFNSNSWLIYHRIMYQCSLQVSTFFSVFSFCIIQ